MRTTKPCSTISYNTDEFLTLKLNDLIRKGHIDFWCYINHHAEEDETKDHKHLLIYPSKLLDTNQLKEELLEADMTNLTGQPLGCMPFRSSKFPDWYLYVLHDSGYLANKGQKRKYHYTDSDLVCSDTDFLVECKHQIDWSKINITGQVVQAAESGMTWGEYLKSANLSLNQIYGARMVFEAVKGMSGDIERNDRTTHSPKFDADGVLIEE